MSIAIRSTTAKVVAGFAGLTMAFTFAFGGVATVNAQTSADLQAQIQSLLQTIAQLQAQLNTVEGGSSMSGLYCNFSFTRDLAQGATGQDVMDLQKFLNSAGLTVAVSGAGSAGMETSYYGPATAAAVSKFQVKYASEILAPLGLTSGTGYFGASSRAKARAVCAATPTTPTTPTTPSTGLKGGAGSLDDVDFVSGLNNEEVGEGDDDVEVAGIDIEADGSDIEIVAVGLDFDQVSADDDFDNYASEVTIWLDGEMVASVDADEFEDDDNYAKTVSLDSGAVIREGDEGRLVVAVSAINNLDSADAGDTWNVQFTSVRFRDSQNAVITDTSTGDIDATSNNDTTTDSYEREFSFETFATAADSELKVKLASDNPESQVVNVDASDDTNNVEVLRFTLEAEGDSDLRVRDLPITLTVTGATDVDAVVNTVTVTIDGEEYSETVSTSTATASITFDDLDYTIDAEDTVEVVVTVDINDIDTGFDEGDTLTASFSASNRAMVDVDDESGETLSTSDRSGTAIGEAMAFYDVAPRISLVSIKETVVDGGNTAYDGTATILIKYTVEAVDGDIYVSDTATATTATSITAETVASNMVLYRVEKSGTPTTDDLASSVVTFTEVSNKVTDDTVTNGVKIFEGETGEFTLTVARINDDAGDAGLYRAALAGVSWATTDTATQNVYDFNLEDYESDYVYID